MDIRRSDYSKMADKASPPSKKFVNFFKAFLVGGTICLIGQCFMRLYEGLGLGEEQTRAFTSVSLVVISAILTGLGVYEKIGKFGGAGSLVPITGFANAVVSPALDNKPEGKILGTGAQIFTIAGPVIVYGVIAATIYGLIIYIASLF